MPASAHASARRATNLSLPEDLVKDARALGVNLSQAAEQGVAAAVAKARGDAWVRENRPALEVWNDHVEKNGLPLARYRDF